MISETRLRKRRLTFRSPINDDHATFPAGAKRVTFVGRPFSLEEAPQHFARLRRWGLTFSASFSLFHAHSFLPLLYKVRFLITLGAVEHEDTYAFDPFVYVSASKSAHITIHPTCAPYSRYPSCAASRPSSHLIRPYGRATPAGTAHPHGRLRRKALTSEHSCCRSDLRPCAGSYLVGLGETAELGGAISPSKFTPPLSCPPICGSI